MNPPKVSIEEYDALPEYERGWIDGVHLYAWWRDGVLYVGTTGRTFATAVDDFLRERGER
jgi:hypothetical protein